MAKLQKFNQLPEKLQKNIESFLLNPYIEADSYNYRSIKQFLFDVSIQLKEHDFTATEPAVIFISALYSIFDEIEAINKDE